MYHWNKKYRFVMNIAFERGERPFAFVRHTMGLFWNDQNKTHLFQSLRKNLLRCLFVFSRFGMAHGLLIVRQ